MRRRRYLPCIRRECMRARLEGFPLCFCDFDELPAASRESWRATSAMDGRDRRQARERWQLAFWARLAERKRLAEVVVTLEDCQPAAPAGGRARGARKAS